MGLFPSWFWKPKNIMPPSVVYGIQIVGHQMVSQTKPVVLSPMSTASVITKATSKCQCALVIKSPTGDILKPLHSSM